MPPESTSEIFEIHDVEPGQVYSVVLNEGELTLLRRPELEDIGAREAEESMRQAFDKHHPPLE